MDKSWIDLPDRHFPPYYNGIDQFLNFAYINRDPGSKIYCPCRKCQNRYFYVRSDVREHLRDSGFFKKYKQWSKHGEPYNYVDPLESNQKSSGLASDMKDNNVRLVQEALGAPNVGKHDPNNEENLTNPPLGPNEPTKQSLKLLEDASLPLYPGSKRHTALSYTVRLLQAKELHGWTDKSFQTLLEISEECMPEGVKLPKSYYEAKKLTEDLGITYKTVGACPNCCMLFRNEDISLNECRICKTSGWKDNGGNSNDIVALVKQKAAKQARYSGEQREEFVHPQAPISNETIEDLINKVTESVTKEYLDQLNILKARVDHLENTEGRATYQSEQAPDATSGHDFRRESKGEDVNSAFKH